MTKGRVHINELTDYQVERLAGYQIDYLIKKNIEVERLKTEWRRRYSLPYPYRKNISYIVKYDHGEELTDEDMEAIKR